MKNRKKRHELNFFRMQRNYYYYGEINKRVDRNRDNNKKEKKKRKKCRKEWIKEVSHRPMIGKKPLHNVNHL